MKRIRLLTAALVAAGSALLLAVPAAASTVTVNDEAGVLNVTTVQNEAANLQVPIYIWTTTQDATNKSVFDSDVQAKVSSQFPIVLGINTQAKHEAIRIGEASGFTQDSANSAASSANSAFDGVMRSRNDYTGAVQAALTSLRSSLGNRSSGEQSTSHGSSVFGGIVLLIIVVVVVAVLARVFRGRRGRRMAGPPMGGYGPGQGYGPGYGPGPGYGGGYGPGYGGGIGPGAAGGIGAVGGGLLGYELGKMSGENEQFRRDEMGYGDQGYGGDQGFGGGDQGGGWVTGQDSDFGGGGDFGGGDSGGGDSGGGGGDW